MRELMNKVDEVGRNAKTYLEESKLAVQDAQNKALIADSKAS